MGSWQRSCVLPLQTHGMGLSLWGVVDEDLRPMSRYDTAERTKHGQDGAPHDNVHCFIALRDEVAPRASRPCCGCLSQTYPRPVICCIAWKYASALENKLRRPKRNIDWADGRISRDPHGTFGSGADR